MALYPDSLFDFPNVSAYDSDLREVLAMLRGLTHEMRDFKAVNKITNAGAWDITKQYKPWTIVSDNNIGYISVCPVPAGIEITNTAYWALVADYDILITNLAERIAALEFENKKKYLIFADSYGALGWTSAVVSETGIDAHIFNHGGAGFIGAGDGTNWNDDIRAYAATLTDAEKREITGIMVFGGVNDYSFTASDIYNAVASFVTYAHSTFTRCKVHIGVISYANGQVRSDVTYALPNKVIPQYKKACLDNSGIFVDLYGCMHNTSYLQADGIHPTANGTRSITNAVKNYILGGLTGESTTNQAATVTITDNHPDLPAPEIYTSIEGSTAMLYCKGFAVAYTNGTKEWNGDYINILNIGTIADTMVQGIVIPDTAQASIEIPIVATVYIDADGTYKNIPAILGIYNGYISIGFRNIVGSHIEHVVTSSFNIPPFSCSFPLTQC